MDQGTGIHGARSLLPAKGLLLNPADEPDAEQGEPPEKKEQGNHDQIFHARDGSFPVGGTQVKIKTHGNKAPAEKQDDFRDS